MSERTSNYLGEDGVHAHHVEKYYGSFRVLKDINLNVSRGTIYGLLGPSGCGKTTLLKVLLGRLEIDEGTISTLGFPPHSKGHHIPGHGIGYAPQEVALHLDLSIHETLLFHSSLHHMPTEMFKLRKEYLLKMLDLPDDSKVVRNLSGGQQRRVSLAVALLHNPELLVLDEPTVGLDPLLRARVWEYLRLLAQNGVTIIVTTHYIEESKTADRVGLMRNGHILEEGRPKDIMKRYELDNLEDVFLYLCRNIPIQRNILDYDLLSDDGSKKDDDEEVSDSHSSIRKMVRDEIDKKEMESGYLSQGSFSNRSEHFQEKNEDMDLIEKMRPKRNRCTPFVQIWALARKDFTQLFRNLLILSWELLVPTVQILVFMIAIGQDPRNLNLIIMQNDVGHDICGISYANLGESILNELQVNHSKTLNLMTNKTLEESKKLVKDGKVWGYVDIPHNYTEAMTSFLCNSDKNFTRNESMIHLRLDFSNFQVSAMILKDVQETIYYITDSIFSSVFPDRSLNPIEYSSEHANMSIKFIDFLAPGIIATIAFAHAIGTTTMTFTSDRVSGCLDRVFMSGISGGLIILGSLLSHSVILIFQVGVMLLITIFAFKIHVEGSLFYVFTVLFFLGLVGMSFGMAVSSMSRNEAEAIQFVLAIFFPSLLLSGIIWPLEAVPSWFSWVSLSLPTTWVSLSLRAIMIKGWNIRYFEVYMGYIVSAGWIIILLSLAAFKLSSKERRLPSKLRMCCLKRNSSQNIQ